MTAGGRDSVAFIALESSESFKTWNTIKPQFDLSTFISIVTFC